MALCLGTSGGPKGLGVSYEPGTPVGVVGGRRFPLRPLITDHWIYQGGFAVLPNPCHYQDYDRPMSLLNLAPRDAPRRCAPKVNFVSETLCVAPKVADTWNK